MSLIDTILDPDRSGPIVMYDYTSDEEIAFDPVAVIPINDDPYFILEPMRPLEGMAEGELAVFSIGFDEITCDEALVLVDDEDIKEMVLRHGWITWRVFCEEKQEEYELRK